MDASITNNIHAKLPRPKFELLSCCPPLRTPSLYNKRLPIPRSGHRLLASEDYVYVIGGFNPALWNEETDASTSSPILREIWRYDLFKRRWDQIGKVKDLPFEMASHAAVLHKNYALIFGGTGVPFGHANSNQLHAFNLKTFAWKTLDYAETENSHRPLPGYGQAATLDDSGNLYIIGGTCGHVYNCDVHRLNLTSPFSLDLSWQTLCVNNRDLARYRHECVFYKDKLLLFGGGTAEDVRPMNVMHVFDLKKRVWESLTTLPDKRCDVADVDRYPSARRCHGLARYKNDVYICGGCTNDLVYDDVWKYSLENNEWHKLSLKLSDPVFFHGFTISKAGCMYIYGGTTATNIRLGNLYRFWLSPPSLKQICSETIALCEQEQLKLSRKPYGNNAESRIRRRWLFFGGRAQSSNENPV